MQNFMEEHFNRFVSFVCKADGDVFHPDAHCMELSLWGGFDDKGKSGLIRKSTHPIVTGGWFNKVSSLKATAKRIDGVSAYVTFNPVDKSRLAQIGNAVGRVRGDEGTKKEDIVCLRYVLIDIDVDRGNSKISATASELQEALGVRDRILDARADIRDNAVWGCSGNGAYILARIEDLPNTPESVGRIRESLNVLSHEFGKKGRGSAHVDVQPHFPNAHIGLPGTKKCKGTETDDRPWRFITVDGGVF